MRLRARQMLESNSIGPIGNFRLSNGVHRMCIAHPKMPAVTEWARQTDDIRALVVTGSLARLDDTTDQFSDLDLQVITRDLQRFKANDNWLNEFDDIWIRFPLNRDLPYRLVWFRGGIKIDFQFLLVGDVYTMISTGDLPDEYMRGYHVVLDKDDLFRDLAPSPRVFPQPPTPTVASLAETINEFWFEAIHVAQFIRRREFWVVKHRDWTMKCNLLRLLEWHAHCKSKDPINTWQLGRRINSWADNEATQALARIWGGWEAQSLWQALFAQLALFRRLTLELSQALGYTYEDKAHQEISNYIHQLYHEDSDADTRD